MTAQTILLPDGRKLGYALFGAPDGRPVLYFHGTPSSRLEVQLLDAYRMNAGERLLSAGVRLIAVDRPGMGLSSFHPRASFLSFAADLEYLLQSLGISRCDVMCWSGGGPYALAMAWRYPAVVRGVYMICAFSRRFNGKMLWQMTLNKWYFLAARYIPALLRGCLYMVRNNRSRHAVPQWATGLSDPDYRLIKDPAQRNVLAACTLGEACRGGARGPVYEARLYFNPFGFDCSGIRQPVHCWWGTADKVVVRTHADTVARQLQNSVLHYKEGEGHLSLYVHCFEEVIQTIASAPAV